MQLKWKVFRNASGPATPLKRRCLTKAIKRQKRWFYCGEEKDPANNYKFGMKSPCRKSYQCSLNGQIVSRVQKLSVGFFRMSFINEMDKRAQVAFPILPRGNKIGFKGFFPSSSLRAQRLDREEIWGMDKNRIDFYKTKTQIFLLSGEVFFFLS